MPSNCNLLQLPGQPLGPGCQNVTANGKGYLKMTLLMIVMSSFHAYVRADLSCTYGRFSMWSGDFSGAHALRTYVVSSRSDGTSLRTAQS